MKLKITSSSAAGTTTHRVRVVSPSRVPKDRAKRVGVGACLAPTPRNSQTHNTGTNVLERR